MSIFSKKNNFKLGVTLSAFAALLSACGGGGGGGSTTPSAPPRSEFMAVSSVNPADKATDIDAQLPGITVTFSENIDPASFVKESTALGALLAKKTNGGSADFSIDKIMDQAGNTVDAVATALTIVKLATNNNSVVGKCVNIDLVDSTRNVINGTLKITGYKFVAEENTGLHSLQLFVQGCSEPFVWSSSQLIESGIVNNNIFKVELISGTSATAIPAMGQISVSGKSITFNPINFLEWSSESKPAEYRVTVKRNVVGGEQGIKELLPVGSELPVRTLQADFVSTFKTKVLPDAKVVSTAPNGIDASPVATIKAITNFKVELASLQNNVRLERLNRTSNDPAVPVVRTPVQATVSYDVGLSQIEIKPVGDLRYLQDYEVTIVGGSSGLRGSQGNVAGRTMVADHKFGFTTSEAKVLSITASNTTPRAAATDASAPGTGQKTTFNVKLNFKPDPTTIAAGVSVLNESTGMVIPTTPSVVNDEITLLPNTELAYGQKYTVTVTPALKSLELRGIENANEAERIVSIAAPVASSFTMETRRMVDAVPTLRNSIGHTSSIVLSFNFDISNEVAANFNTAASAVKLQQSGVGASAQPIVVVRRTASRVIEILAPSSGYKFDVELVVSVNFPVVDGQPITVAPLTFRTAPSNTLTISGYTPSATSGVGLNSEISVTFSYQLEALTANQLNSSHAEAAIKLSLDGSSSSCQFQSGPVGGRITHDTNKIYFLPSAGLKSWCKYKVTVNPNLKSFDNRVKPTSANWSWEFTANGLAVNNVYVTYAHGTKVSVRQPIEVTFNYDLSYFQWSDAVILTERASGSRVSVSTSVYRNEFTIDPYSDLKYNTEYKLVVKSGPYGVEGDDEETLASDYVVYFTTEQIPLDVDNYGPIGTVRTDSRFFVEFDRSVTTPGFPYITATLNGNSQTVSNDGIYTFSFKPVGGLTPGGYDYRPRFMWNDEYFEWTVRSAATASAAANKYGLVAPTSKAVVSKLMHTYLSVPRLAVNPVNGEVIVTGEDFADSCARRTDCVGMLRSGNETRYRQLTLRGLTKADIGHNATNARNR